MNDLQFANIKFRKWFEVQTPAQKALIEAKAAEIRTDPDIAHMHRTGSHARLSRLMAWCSEQFGYDFT